MTNTQLLFKGDLVWCLAKGGRNAGWATVVRVFKDSSVEVKPVDGGGFRVTDSENVFKVDVPEIPEPDLAPGFYRSTGACETDYYALLPDGRWVWLAFDLATHGSVAPEYIDRPAMHLSELEEWV